MKKLNVFAGIFCVLLVASCQQTMFGVDQEVWSTLSEKEREKVIEGYNERKEMELAHQQKRQEKELEIERRQKEIDAQNAPIYAAAEAVTSIFRGESENSPMIRIQSIQSKRGKQILTIRDEQFEVPSYIKMDSWLKGQRVELRNGESFLYPVDIKNLDNGDRVSARKSTPTFY